MIHFVFLALVNKLIMFEYLVVLSFHFEIYVLKFYVTCEHFLLINRISHACTIHMSKAYKKA